MKENCTFCDLIKNKTENKKPENTIIFENANFIVVPSLGSIVDGYLMLISKRHINSMAELSNDELADLVVVLNDMKALLFKNYGVSPIVCEHGSGIIERDKASSSVYHAHIHIVPINFDEQRHKEIIAECKMRQIDIVKDLQNYCQVPYILYIDEKQNAHISKSTDIIMPSQYMRKKIAEQEGLSDKWNWRNNSFKSNISKTIKKLV